MRPGFKYGCRWRVYSTSVEEDHAPWLMQMEQDAPSNWEGVCLSVRLAEGVNKGWVIAIKRSSWNFLVISRHLPGR
jgi:tRNA splicing endonuclease